MSDELKPCPFCGTIPEYEVDIDGEWIECVAPGCDFGVNDGKEWWNTRPIEDALQAKLVTAEHMAFDYRNERDAYMQSYDNVCKERDALQAKLDIAVEALDLINSGGQSGTWSSYTCADIAITAIKKLNNGA